MICSSDAGSCAWRKARHILCMRLDGLGDLLMTVPALHALHEAVPGRRLTLLCSSAGSALAGCITPIDDTIVFSAPWMKPQPGRNAGRALRDMAELLERKRFDGAVIFTVYSQSPFPAATLAFLAGIPLRLACCRENPYHLLTDWVRESEPGRVVRHETRRQLDLVGAAGGSTADRPISLGIPLDVFNETDALLRAGGVDPDKPWIAVHPGASAASRRYPPRLFAEAAGLLSVDPGLPLVFTGEAAEIPLVESIRKRIGARTVSLAGKITAVQLAAAIARCAVLLSNNTAPVHMAAASGTPVVDLYALTNPQHTPWMVAHRTLSHATPCKNCYQSVCPRGDNYCLSRIPPETVAGAVRELLGAV